MRVVAWIPLVIVLASMAIAQPLELKRPKGLIEPDIPLDQPLTAELVSLGKVLFFDSRLSRTGTTSCATCHDPAFGYADPRRTSVSDGGIPQKRNAPSLYNVGFLPTLMWDGRFRTLESQSLDPFRRDGEMGQDVDAAVALLKSDAQYQILFEAAFGMPATADRMAIALASFQRTLLAGDSRFDAYLFGGDEAALSPAEKRGLDVFSNRAGCLNCHDVFHPRFNPLGGGVALFTDFRFHNLGVGYAFGQFRDSGRYGWSRNYEELGAFRTPSLRNLTLTAPYMHDGSLQTLDEVVDFYDRGGKQNSHISPSIRKLHLTVEEKQALVDFLESLTSPDAVALAKSSTPAERPDAFVATGR